MKLFLIDFAYKPYYGNVKLSQEEQRTQRLVYADSFDEAVNKIKINLRDNWQWKEDAIESTNDFINLTIFI